MKALKLTILLFLACNFTLHAQTDVFDKFVGTWEYKTATEIFTISLKKGIISGTESVYGAYGYVKNGKTEKVLPSYVGTKISQNRTISGDNRRRLPSNIISGIFYDEKKDKFCYLTITLISTSEIRWELSEPEGIRLVIDGVDMGLPKGFSVPTDVIMKKIK